MKEIITTVIIATVIVNTVMVLLLLNVGGEFRRTVRASIISALLANLWAFGALLLLLYPLELLGGMGRLLFLVAPMGIMYWLIFFVEDYPFGGKMLSSRTKRLIQIGFIAAVIIVVSCQALLIPYSVPAQGMYYPHIITAVYASYALYFAVFSWLYSRIYIQKMKHIPAERKQQAWFAYSGTLVSSFVAFLTNLLLPLTGVTGLIWIGPASSFIYAISFLYAMRRYRLFELRRFALRGIVYAVALSIVVTTYALLVSMLRIAVERIVGTPVSSDIFYSFMTVFAMLFYTPLKKRFDEITKAIFFKKDYEIQNIIDRLGDVLLRTNSRQDVAMQVSRLLRSTLLTKNINVVLADESTTRANDLAAFFARRTRSVISLDTDENDTQTIAWMRDREYEVVASIHLRGEIIGWIVLGPKRSGDAYQEKDITLLDIASGEIAIAMESAMQYEQIEEFNRTLQEKVRDATIELRQTNTKLRELDASKDEFISMASHQLRTPLTSIKGYISMLLDGDLGDLKPAQKQALEQAYDSSQRMVYLIGDFLNLSRIQTGRFELEKTNVSLPKILAEEIDQLRQSAKSRNITLLYDAPKDFPLIEADETKLRQVMMNFIDNAIYYAKPDGGEILLVLERRRDEIVFVVKDNGIGVPAHERKHLFTKFYRAGNARKARPDGTGIGLFMAKRVVVSHGGVIVFESKEGEGSEFGFRLPLSSGNK